MMNTISFPRRFSWIAGATAFAALTSASLYAQNAACPAVTPGDPTPAEAAYAAARYSQAEDLFGQELAQHPHDLKLSAALVHTWLREGQTAQAAAQVNRILPENPNSAITLTSLAEVRLRQGQPWLALETLKTAEAADPCYARIYLIRSRALRIDSMYASERAEIQKAYDIDPSEPDIRHAWLSTVSPASEIEAIAKSLTNMKDIDADTRQKAQDSIDSMMPLLSENNQTCKILPTAEAASFPLQPSFQDAKHIEAYRLEVDFPKSKAKLQVDTAASGLFISRALADANGFQAAGGDPPGTVRVESVHIGPLEFRDCIVGVSEMSFTGKADGFIGTDMFASWLITLDQPGAKLTLSPLPKQAGMVPGDRVVPAELRDYMPVYHRQQYLLVPAMLNNKSRRLFALDTGIRFSTMTSEVAHSVSSTKVNFTNPMQTVSGATLQVYRDSFDFQLANLTMAHQSHILEMDPANVEHNAGMQIAGMLGFDMLHSFVLHLDYRDGLVKMESAELENGAGGGKGTLTASSKPVCEPGDERDRPVGSTIEAKVTGLLDSAHLKPGKEITVQVVNEWEFPGCNLPSKSLLYGHVTAASSSRNPDA
jgi:tetratricopeptide (TPR) repeat protein